MTKEICPHGKKLGCMFCISEAIEEMQTKPKDATVPYVINSTFCNMCQRQKLLVIYSELLDMSLCLTCVSSIKEEFKTQIKRLEEA